MLNFRIYFLFFIIRLFWNCFLCRDRWNGDVTPTFDAALLSSSRAGYHKRHNYFPAPYYLKSDKPFLTLSNQTCSPGVDFSILKEERFAVCPTFSHEFVAQKFGELLVGRTTTFDRAISMNVAEQKSYEKSTPDELELY